MKISTKDGLIKFVLIMFSVYAFCGSGIDYFFLPYAYNAQKIFVVSSMFLMVAFCVYKHRNWKRSDSLTYLPFIMILVVLFWNNYNFANGEYFRVYQFIAVILLYFILKGRYDLSWMRWFCNITIGVGIFYAFFTILTFFSKSFYLTIVPTLQKYNSAYNLLNQYEQGYMAGITKHYTTNGIYLVTGILPLGAAVCCRSLKEISFRKRIAICGLFVAVLFALLLSGKRAHTLFAVAALLISIYYYYSDRPRTRKIKIITGLFIATLALFVASYFVPQVLNVVNRFLEADESTAGLTSGRDLLQAQIYSVIATHPVFGVGWGWFPWNNSFSPGDYAHNVYLELLAECGIVGTLPFIIFFIVCFRRTIHSLKRAVAYRQKNSEVIKLLSVSLCYQSFFLLYCITGNPLYDFNCYFPYFVWCAVSESLRYKLSWEE